MCWGMLDKVGNIDYVEVYEGYQGNIGGFLVLVSMKEFIEEEVKCFIQDGYDCVVKIIQDNKDEWECLVEGLFEYEILIGEEIECVMCGELFQLFDNDSNDDNGLVLVVFLLKVGCN